MTGLAPRVFLLAALVATTLSAQRAPIPQHLVFTPYRASGIYDVGDTVGWTITPATSPPSYAFKWTIRRNNAVVLKEGTLDLSTGKAAIEIVADEPAMIYVAVEGYEDLVASTTRRAGGDSSRFIGGNTGRDTGFYAVGAAVAPKTIPLSTARPAAVASKAASAAACARWRPCSTPRRARRRPPRRERRRRADARWA